MISEKRDILELLSSISNAEVFTPPRVVNEMLDLLPKDIWSNPHIRLLDPCVKSGVFLRESFFRFYKGLQSKEEGLSSLKKGDRIYDFFNDKDRADYIFKYMLFGIATSYLTSLISRRTLYGVMFAHENKEDFIYDDVNVNSYYDNTIFDDKEGNIYYESKQDLGRELEDSFYPFIEDNILNKKIKLIKENKMKFDVIIGNPPYQISDGGQGASAKPIYHKFIENSIKINPKYISMIVPSRWMTGGKGLDRFRKKMLEDKRIKEINDFKNGKECFPSVDIKGGINYFLWDYQSNNNLVLYKEIENNKEISIKERILNKHNVFIRDNKSISILDKIDFNKNLSNIILSRNPFNITTNFKEYSEKKDDINNIKLYGNKNLMKNTNGIGYVSIKNINKNKEIINKYKVLIPKANGSGSQGKVIGNPFLAEPNSISSETYLIMNVFLNKEISFNYIKYIKTKFFRFLVSLLKNTQDNPKGVFAFVPDLPMDQEWTDEKLYKKYSLTEEEIDYIEEKIAVME